MVTGRTADGDRPYCRLEGTDFQAELYAWKSSSLIEEVILSCLHFISQFGMLFKVTIVVRTVVLELTVHAAVLELTVRTVKLDQIFGCWGMALKAYDSLKLLLLQLVVIFEISIRSSIK